MIEFNPEKNYLGKLCPSAHEYKNTGKSLRFKSSRGCCECANKHSREHPEYREKRKVKKAEYDKMYRAENREHKLEQDKKYYRENLEYRKEYEKKRRLTPVVKKQNKIRSKQLRDNLHDSYVKAILIKTTPFETFNEIPTDIVTLKKEQMSMYRQIKEAKNGITGTRDQRT